MRIDAAPRGAAAPHEADTGRGYQPPRYHQRPRYGTSRGMANPSTPSRTRASAARISRRQLGRDALVRVEAQHPWLASWRRARPASARDSRARGCSTTRGREAAARSPPWRRASPRRRPRPRRTTRRSRGTAPMCAASSWQTTVHATPVRAGTAARGGAAVLARGRGGDPVDPGAHLARPMRPRRDRRRRKRSRVVASAARPSVRSSCTRFFVRRRRLTARPMRTRSRSSSDGLERVRAAGRTSTFTSFRSLW